MRSQYKDASDQSPLFNIYQRISKRCYCEALWRRCNTKNETLKKQKEGKKKMKKIGNVEIPREAFYKFLSTLIKSMDFTLILVIATLITGIFSIVSINNSILRNIKEFSSSVFLFCLSYYNKVIFYRAIQNTIWFYDSNINDR